jgi:hypothetical protein
VSVAVEVNAFAVLGNDTDFVALCGAQPSATATGLRYIPFVDETGEGLSFGADDINAIV